MSYFAKDIPFRQIHLDFHTSEKIENVGVEFDAVKFADKIKDANINSVTIFAKCHHGMIYYDTKLEARHPHLCRDMMTGQLKELHTRGINAPIYISLGFDEYMARKHPEWVQRNKQGENIGWSQTDGFKTIAPTKDGWKSMCFNSDYIGYVKEQVVELFDIYGDEVDGIWFDIVSQKPCYCQKCLDDMKAQGFDPLSDDDVIKFAGEVLYNTREELSSLIREYKKDAMIFFNSGHVSPEFRGMLSQFTHLELESLPSGSYGYEHFPIAASYVRNLGVEFLGMTARFNKSWADFGGFKNQNALNYECLRMAAYGARCSVGDQMHPRGYLDDTAYKRIKRTYAKIAEYEQYYEKVDYVKEIGVVSPEIIKQASLNLPESVRGVYRLLKEEHYQFDIIDEKENFGNYALIILPDEIVLNEELNAKINKYVKDGGKVFASFKSGLNVECSEFAIENMGVSYVGESEYNQEYLELEGDDTKYILYEKGLHVLADKQSKVLGKLWKPYFNRSYDYFCSHFQTPYDEVQEYPLLTLNNSKSIAYCSHPIFTLYKKYAMNIYRTMVKNVLDTLLNERAVKITAPSYVETIFNEQKDKSRYVLNILSYIPERRSPTMDVIEDEIFTPNTDVEIRMEQDAKKVYTVKNNEQIEFVQNDGSIKFSVKDISGYELVVIQY